MPTTRDAQDAVSSRSPADKPYPILVLVGPSGSGRSTAAAALEDLGFAVVDNPPLSLLEEVAEALRVEARATESRGLALSLAPPSASAFVASGGSHPVAEAVARLRRRPEFTVTLIYLDAEDSVLLRRYKETRRRHPRGGEALAEAVAQERAALRPLRTQADLTLDTSDLTPHELRAEIAERFDSPDRARMTVSVISFGFKNGAPRDADLMFDARFLSNPYWRPELRPLSGRDAPVAEFVAADPNSGAFLKRLSEMLTFLLPLYEREGKSYLNIAIGCTGGQHRSVYAAEAIARSLREAGWSPKLRHRDMRAS
ncbi:RNase adapter RapZ [Neomegalonema sp.]|uniref:RNase adapter RapZ n=1 Tax=Neomegalonema sp. TaxID=2039713 RepID=UPI002611D708|nr:RNase adapter RapZ [Neomegalonema sp.]MDD2867123.1 RNase adapter RapZ [Neomegalonema sp.]